MSVVLLNGCVFKMTSKYFGSYTWNNVAHSLYMLFFMSSLHVDNVF